MQLSSPLGIFGGTFDPVHNGHLNPVIEGAKITNIKQIALLPCYIPSHKNAAKASSYHRLNMLELASAQHPLFFLDSRDIDRAKPTVSLDSLNELREAKPTTPLCFFIGTDSLNSLTTWYKWQDLFSLCHFVVCVRESTARQNNKTKPPHSYELPMQLKNKQTLNPDDLHRQLAGCIYLANTQTYNLSSTAIRERLALGQSVEGSVPQNVLNYIRQHKLYQTGADIC